MNTMTISSRKFTTALKKRPIAIPTLATSSTMRCRRRAEDPDASDAGRGARQR